MNDSERTSLRSILNEYEAGSLTDDGLTERLSSLSPEQLGWIAAESIRRYEELAGRSGYSENEARGGFGLQTEFAK